MPLYEYQCRKCGHRFERIRKFSDPPLKKCPECGGAVKQLMSAPAVQFKGSGWYVTDYARKGKAASGSGDGAGGEAAAKAGEKPQPKTETKKPEKKK